MPPAVVVKPAGSPSHSVRLPGAVAVTGALTVRVAAAVSTVPQAPEITTEYAPASEGATAAIAWVDEVAPGISIPSFFHW